jgi:hypothetical protein
MAATKLSTIPITIIQRMVDVMAIVFLVTA